MTGIDPPTVLQFVFAAIATLIGREGFTLVRAKFGNGHTKSDVNSSGSRGVPLTVIVSTETDRGVREVRAIIAGEVAPLNDSMSHVSEMMARLVALTEVLVGQGRHK